MPWDGHPQDMQNLLAEIKMSDYVDHVVNIKSLTLISIKTILDRSLCPTAGCPLLPWDLSESRNSTGSSAA